MVRWVSGYIDDIKGEQEFTAVIPGPHCKLGIQASNSMVFGVDFLSQEVAEITVKNEITEEVVVQLNRWLLDSEWVFDLPLVESGTAFQKRVWRALLQIKPGYPKTYGGLASELGSGARAVGNACRANPYPVIVPCHRIIAANGLGGFAGERRGMKLETKLWLLSHEGFKLR